MRLFVAVDPDDSARQAAAATAEELRRAIEPALKARRVPIENMHVHRARTRRPTVNSKL